MPANTRTGRNAVAASPSIRTKRTGLNVTAVSEFLTTRFTADAVNIFIVTAVSAICAAEYSGYLARQPDTGKPGLSGSSPPPRLVHFFTGRTRLHFLPRRFWGKSC